MSQVVKIESIGEDVINSEGVMSRRATKIYHHITGTTVTIMPPNPYPSKAEQQRVLDDILDTAIEFRRSKQFQRLNTRGF